MIDTKRFSLGKHPDRFVRVADSRNGHGAGTGEKKL
jgi:hypothetical protein